MEILILSIVKYNQNKSSGNDIAGEIGSPWLRWECSLRCVLFVWSREGDDDYTALIPVLSSQAAPHLDAAGFPLLRGLWRREHPDQRQTALFVSQRVTPCGRCPIDGVHTV